MTAVLELLLNGIIRTTLCTTLAAVVALGLLRVLRTRSTRVHRVAWVLVILQGWVLVPVTFTVLEQRPVPVVHSSQYTVSYVAAPQLRVTSAKPQAARGVDWWGLGEQGVVAVWLLGTGIVLGVCLWRYYALVARIPLGSVSKSSEWNDEWREVTAEATTNKNVCFRVTHQVGPLLCFMPFVYLVLVPRLLWSRLSREDRLAILRHELAHLQHGDLWKNVLIRLFALPQWFNPLVWLAVHRFEEAGEWACDEAVVASSTTAKTGANTDYASTLLRVAGFATDAPCGAVAATGGKLTRRVTRLLASTNKEVLQMKDLFVVVLLLTIAVGQAIRIESVYADKPAQPTSKQGEVVADTTVKATLEKTLLATRAEEVAKWQSSPYVVEPPDVLSIIIAQPADKQEDDTLTDFEVKELNKQQQYLVGPDGHVDFGDWGSVFVAGKTLKEINTAIERQLGGKLKALQVTSKVTHYNSKVIYVVTKDNVTRLPFSGKYTVLDAISQSGAIPLNPFSKIWISRPASNGARKPVDWDDVSHGVSMATNYQLLPGDRLFVETKSNAVPLAQAATPILKQPTPTEAAIEIRSSSQAVKVKATTEKLPATRDEQVAKWQSSPYVVEPPDILQINIDLSTGKQETLNDFGGKGLNKQQYLVGPDGRVDFGRGGTVFVAGKTLKEINTAIERQLGVKIKDPQVTSKVIAYYSKVVYVITQGGGFDDHVTRLPISGKYTVLDAISHGATIPLDSISKTYIAQSAPNGVGKDRILPVNWEDVSHGISMMTNYELMPGDRIFIERNSDYKEDATKATENPTKAPPAVGVFPLKLNAEPENRANTGEPFWNQQNDEPQADHPYSAPAPPEEVKGLQGMKNLVDPVSHPFRW